jgi:hypothetical protein
MKNDSISDNLLIESFVGSTVKNILNATSNGNILNLLKDSDNPSGPFLYVGKNNGRVYDSVYNTIPALQSNPTFNSITTDTTMTVGTNAIVNGTTTLKGTTTMNGNTTIASTGMLKAIGDSSHEPSLGSTSFFKNGQTGSEVATGRIATLTDNIMLQGQNRVTIGSYGDPEELASFNTAQPWNTASNFSPVFNLRGYMKYTLPAYGNPTGGLQMNQHIYLTNNSISQTINGDPKGWPLGSYLGQWYSTALTSNAYIITVGSTGYAGWQCPTSGIWEVSFNSSLGTGAVVSLGIGNYTKSQPYGINKVTVTVAINQGDIILTTGEIGGATAFFQCFMSFSLIMELNPAKNT